MTGLGPRRVLVADDEPKIRDLVRRYLEADGFEVIEAGDGAATLQAFESRTPDVLVLDVAMPLLNGLEVLRRIRLRSRVPVLLLTAREDEIDKVVGLMSGADDYVTKPFGGRELAARVHTILRRHDTVPNTHPQADGHPAGGADADAGGDGLAWGPVLRFDGLTIDLGRHLVSTLAGPVALTAMDFALLAALARAPGQVLSRRQLLAAVWNDDTYTDERVVDVHIRTVRRALGDDAGRPVIVETVRSVGYRFLPRPLAAPPPSPHPGPLPG